MIKVYVAGPYRADTTWGIHCNIQRAKAVGLDIAKMGANPFIPHANTGYYDGELPEQFWLDADIEWLSHCDCMYVLPGSENSRGTQNEIAYCEDHGLPIFHTLDALAAYLNRQDASGLDW